MTKRVASVVLWSFCGLYAGAYLAFLVQSPVVVGEILGLTVVFLIGSDARTYLITPRASPALNVSDLAYRATVTANARPDAHIPG